MKKKQLGIILIVLGLLFINFFPDPTDIVTLQLFSATTGADISPANLPIVYFDFIIWSTIIGAVLIILGMNLSSYSVKRIMKKFDLGKYNIAVLLAILTVGIIAFMDIQGMIYWASFSSSQSYINGEQGIHFWNFFKNSALAIFLIVPLAYYFLVKKDLSESFSIWLTQYLAWMFGLADVLFFILQRKAIPLILPWLNSHPIIGFISKGLGFEQVTNISLILSMFMGLILIFISNKLLKEKL